MRSKWTLCGIFALGLAAAGCSNELKVSEVDPPNGAFTGGEEVELKGNGFQPGRGGVTVKFGRKDAMAVVVESGDKIKVTTPSGDKNTTVDVSVVFDDGRSFLIKNGFHFVDTSQQRATMNNAFNALGDKDKQKDKK